MKRISTLLYVAFYLTHTIHAQEAGTSANQRFALEAHENIMNNYRNILNNIDNRLQNIEHNLLCIQMALNTRGNRLQIDIYHLKNK